MSLLSPDGTREKGRSEWASIVLCSRQFTHTHLPNHTHSLLLYNEINALSFPLCAQHLTVPKASCDQTPHHVLKLLILMLAQCSFCTLVWLFIRIVLMPFLMGVFIRFSFLNGYSLSYNGFVLLLFCVSDHMLAIRHRIPVPRFSIACQNTFKHQHKIIICGDLVTKNPQKFKP